MGAFSGVKSCFNKPLAEVAQSLHYDESNIVILEGDEIRLREEFPQVYNDLLSCRHHADGRTPLQYGQDLVASWLFEDMFLWAFKKTEKLTIKLDGADKKRIILPSAKTSAASDYLVSTAHGSSRKLELMCDYKDFWSNNGKLHLRDEKYTKMKASQSILIAVSVTLKKFAIFDFARSIPAKFLTSHRPYGGKPVYEMDINPESMIAYTSNNLINEIEKAMGV